MKSNTLSPVDETINHLILHKKDKIKDMQTVSTKIFYNYIHAGKVEIKPIDLPRMLRRKTIKLIFQNAKKELPLLKDLKISKQEKNLDIEKVILSLVKEMVRMVLI